MSGIRYHMNNPPAVGRGAFLPRPVGGGHATPASSTHGVVHVAASMTARVPAPAPPNAAGLGSSVGSKGAPGYIVPSRWVTVPNWRNRRMGWNPERPRPIPIPAETEVATISGTRRRPVFGGAKENTPWPKAWQQYTGGR